MPKPAQQQQQQQPAAVEDEVNVDLESDTLDRLFSPDPFVPKSGAALAEDEEEEEEQEEQQHEEEEEDQEEQEDVSEEEEEDDEEDETPPRESVAQQQARENGRRVKELEISLTERDLEITNLRSELEKHRERVRQFEIKNSNPYQHPDVVSIKNEILTDVRTGAELLPHGDGSILVQNFGSYMERYMIANGLSDAERSTAIGELKASIIDDLKAFDSPYSDLFDDDKREADKLAVEALRIIQRNVKGTEKMRDTVEGVVRRAKTGMLAMDTKSYEQAHKTMSTVFTSLESLPKDVADADPYSLEAIVSKKLAKKDPEFIKTYEKAKEEVLEAFIGPRALTQREIDALEASGKDIEEFNRARTKKAEATRKRLASVLIQAVLAKPTIAAALKKAARVKGQEDSAAALDDVFDNIGKRKPAPKTAKPAYVPASERPSAVDKLFAD